MRESGVLWTLTCIGVHLWRLPSPTNIPWTVTTSLGQCGVGGAYVILGCAGQHQLALGANYRRPPMRIHVIRAWALQGNHPAASVRA
jgi:hypothetical protein